jgi:plastocyanin
MRYARSRAFFALLVSRQVALACLAGTLSATAIVACDDRSASTGISALDPPVFGDATIRGSVRFIGQPPPLAMIDMKGTCRDARPIQEETIVVGPSGGLRDVVVWLDDAPPSNGAGRPSPVLDQVGCRYEPHVLGVQVGTPLTITTSDPEFHNVHWIGRNNPGQNLGFNFVGQKQAVAFNRPEFLRMRCDVHPWMESHVAVLPNPFFSVTNSDGTFTVQNVPAGTYQVKTWHALLGERTASVTVTTGGEATLLLEYARPGSR